MRPLGPGATPVTDYDVVVSLGQALPAYQRMAIEVPVDVGSKAADKRDGESGSRS